MSEKIIKNPIFDDGKLLPIMEEFYSLQGEGYHTGKAAYFIRIGGCDIGCKWCDVKMSWKALHLALQPVERIVENAIGFSANAIVVTGGEPALYPLDFLCDSFKQNKFETFLETSGAYPLTGFWDWVCLSPKRNKAPKSYNYMFADELKVIISSREDLEWAEYNSLKVRSRCILYLQPEWSVLNEILPEIIEYIKKNPKWRISLQAHKFMNIP